MIRELKVVNGLTSHTHVTPRFPTFTFGTTTKGPYKALIRRMLTCSADPSNVPSKLRAKTDRPWRSATCQRIPLADSMGGTNCSSVTPLSPHTPVCSNVATPLIGLTSTSGQAHWQPSRNRTLGGRVMLAINSERTGSGWRRRQPSGIRNVGRAVPVGMNAPRPNE